MYIYAYLHNSHILKYLLLENILTLCSNFKFRKAELCMAFIFSLSLTVASGDDVYSTLGKMKHTSLLRQFHSGHSEREIVHEGETA